MTALRGETPRESRAETSHLLAVPKPKTCSMDRGWQALRSCRGPPKRRTPRCSCRSPPKRRPSAAAVAAHPREAPAATREETPRLGPASGACALLVGGLFRHLPSGRRTHTRGRAVVFRVVCGACALLVGGAVPPVTGWEPNAHEGPRGGLRGGRGAARWFSGWLGLV